MKTYATASIPKYLLYTFSLVRLEEVCKENLVVLKALRYSENQVVCKLYGAQEDIRAAIKNLYQEINEDCKEHAELIKKVQKRIPNELSEYAEAFNDDESYQKNFEDFAGKYMRHCTINNLEPHPEVSEVSDTAH